MPGGTPLTAENDRIAVAVNNAATQKEVDRAEADATSSATATTADGLGSRLGTLSSDALSGGRLPKTSALSSRVTQGLDTHDAAKDHYGYLRPYVRLGFAGDGGDVYESQDGSYSSLAISGSYPSGHTYGGYEAGTVLATLLPELAPSILARTSEYGNNRIVLGFHYPLDVMGGRITGQATVAHRWADPDFAKLLTQAHTEIENVLLAQCEKEGYGDTLAACEGDSATTGADPQGRTAPDGRPLRVSHYRSPGGAVRASPWSGPPPARAAGRGGYESGKREPWNGTDRYISFGEEPGGRSWGDARRYGFVSAGSGCPTRSGAVAGRLLRQPELRVQASSPLHHGRGLPPLRHRLTPSDRARRRSQRESTGETAAYSCVSCRSTR